MKSMAVEGHGIVWLPRRMVAPELADGRLVAAWGAPVAGDGSYYLVWPRVGESYPPLQAFRAWLVAEAADPEGEDMLPR